MTDPSARAAARVQSQTYSQEASAVARSLGLAVFSASWILAGLLNSGAGEQGVSEATLAALKSSPELYWAATLSLASLAVDLVQYLLATLLWVSWSGRAPEMSEVMPPRWVTLPALLVFIVKMILLVGGSVALLAFII